MLILSSLFFIYLILIFHSCVTQMMTFFATPQVVKVHYTRVVFISDKKFVSIIYFNSVKFHWFKKVVFHKKPEKCA